MTDRTTHPHAARNRNPRPETIPRAEHGSDEDRPLAEIRKTIHDALRIVSVHRWAFLVPFCLVASGAFLGSLYLPRTYTASTTFDRRNDPVIMNLPMSAGAASFNHFRSTMERDLTSVPNIADAIDKAGLTKDLPRDEAGNLTPGAQRERTAMAAGLASTLSISKVSPNDQLDIITITYTGPDPTIGKSLVEQLKKVYIARTMVWVREFLESQRDYLMRQAAEALEELRIAQREETRLRLENPYFDPNDPGGLITRVTQLEIERRELELRKLEYDAELTALRQLLAATDSQTRLFPAASPPDHASVMMATPRAVRLVNQLAEVKKEIDDLRDVRGMTDQHPRVQELLDKQRALDEELAELKHPREMAMIETAGEQPASIARVESSPYWNAEEARLKVRIEAQESKIRDLDLRLESNEKAIAELRKARQDVYLSQEVFAAAMDEVTRARQRYYQLENAVATIEPTLKATEQGRLLQFSEGQPPRGTPIPIKPKAQTIVFLALFAGLIAGAIFVILAEVFDHVFRTSGQVSRSLGIPILEAIDEIVTTADRRKHLFRNFVVAPALFVIFAGMAGGTGMLAYLSIERPWTYERIINLPARAVRQVLPGSSHTTERPESHSVETRATAS